MSDLKLSFEKNPTTDVSYLIEHDLGLRCPYEIGHLAEPNRDGIQYWVLNCGARLLKSRVTKVYSLPHI